MDSLRPDKDDLDQYQQARKGKPARKAATTSTAKQSAKPQSAPQTRGSVISWLTMSLILVTAGLGGWIITQQFQEIERLSGEVGRTEALIRQAELVMARFEGSLTETGQVIEASGSEVEKKLAFLDSEMRKLWGIAYDRNRKAINENDTELNSLTTKQAAIASDQNKLQKQVSRIEQDGKKTDEVLAALTQQLGQIESAARKQQESLQQMSGKLDAVAALEEKLASIARLERQLQQNNLAIQAIDASRTQLNERIVGLENRLNSLQLQQGTP